MKRVIVVLLVTLICVVGCDLPWEDDDDSASCPSLVAGTYTFITDEGSGTCSDGSSGPLEPMSMRINVYQDDNWLTLEQISSAPPGGIEIVSGNNMEGAFEGDCNFVTDQQILATIEGYTGTVSINYVLDGKFTDSGWKGEYNFSAIFNDYSLSCNWSAAFHGDRSQSANLYNDMETTESDTEYLIPSDINSINKVFGRLVGN